MNSSVGKPRWLVLGESLALVAMIGWVDYVTGWEWSFFVFYALPIVFVVWKFGQRLGFLFAFISAVVWWLAQIDTNPYKTDWGFGLAVASRFFYFGVVVVAVAAVEQRRELDHARIASLERAQQLEMEILRTSEREQQRIGRDLHDSLGPHLAAIGYAVDFLASDLRERREPAVEKLDRIGALVGEAISLTRGMARGIFPVQMDSSGLAIALDDLAETTTRMTGVSVEFCETGNTLIGDPEAAMHLFRVAQEAVNNAVRHGAAKHIAITLSTNEGITRLAIADDGCGMSRSQSGIRGIGMHSMRYRARALGGELKIESRADEGTTIFCEVPVFQIQPKNSNA